MKLSELKYSLPSCLIAQEPLDQRDSSRLLILNRKKHTLAPMAFKDIGKFFSKGDVLVLNKTKVIPARLYARRKTGAKIEVLLLEKKENGTWLVLLKPSKRLKLLEEILFVHRDFKARIEERTIEGKWLLRFFPSDIRSLISKSGIIPTPPYIKKKLTHPERYQTVFAQKEGSVAAPTAGLHFTKELINNLKSQGVHVAYIILHVGIGTFRPIKVATIEKHRMESEYFQIPSNVAQLIYQAKGKKKQVVGCGTSVVRALESQAFINEEGKTEVRSGRGMTDLFIVPEFKFRVIDSLITNFHLPHSTNLVLVSAFAGKSFILRAYRYAIKNKFRFYSFGDAMLIL